MTPAAGEVRARRHRGLFWSAVLVALALLVGGAVVAYQGYAATSGPDGAVRGYFAALQRGDAPAALAFGTVPSGPRTLLSRTVLREQLDDAALRDIDVTAVQRDGDTARVSVNYVLAFSDLSQTIHDSVVVRRHGGSWRLANSAVSVQVELAQASDRATLAGRTIPAEPVLMFPGALPIRFDTSYLQLDQGSRVLQLNGGGQTDLAVVVTKAGQDAVAAALTRELPACLAGAPTAKPSCPRPGPRAVPDSLRGTMTGPVRPSISVANGSAGMIDVSAQITVRGSYQVLNFNNIAITKTGTVALPVRATAYATSPIQLAWTDDGS